MPFGKYKDEALEDVPENYWEWFLEQEWAEEKYPDVYTWATTTQNNTSGTKPPIREKEDVPLTEDQARLWDETDRREVAWQRKNLKALQDLADFQAALAVPFHWQDQRFVDFKVWYMRQYGHRFESDEMAHSNFWPFMRVAWAAWSAAKGYDTNTPHTEPSPQSQPGTNLPIPRGVKVPRDDEKKLNETSKIDPTDF